MRWPVIVAMLLSAMWVSAAASGSHGKVPTTINVLAEGDSITVFGNVIATTTITSYAQFFAASPTANTTLTDKALTGSTLQSVTARGPADDFSIVPGALNIYTTLTGANDLDTYPGGTDAIAAANYESAIFALAAARRAAGWKVCIVTILSVNDTAGNIRRNLINSVLRSAVGKQIDCVVDFAADPTMGTDSSCNNNPSDWFADCVHPTTIAHQTYLFPIYTTAITGAIP
jgi:hypothetical protein